MIKVSLNPTSFKIQTTTARDLKLLSQPYLKLYLRKYLSGIVEPNSWTIPGNSIKILNQIIEILGECSIDFILDQNTQELASKSDIERQEYLERLNSAEQIKATLSNKDKIKIQAELSISGFKRQLTDEQLHALNHLITIGNGANFSVPGSGKTSVALAYFSLLKAQKNVNTLFVIGPISVFEPWKSEYFKCFNEEPKAITLAGKPKDQRVAHYFRFQEFKMFLISYQTASRDVENIIDLFKHDKVLLVLDESHYVKNPNLGVLSSSVLEFGKYAQRRIILTGTPMPNGIQDLWTQITFLWDEQKPLGENNAFLRRTDQPSPTYFDEVKKTINPFFFRITKNQLSIPLPKFNFFAVDLCPIQQRIYDGVAIKYLSKTNFSSFEKEHLRELRRARSIRLLQIASNPSLLYRKCDEFSLPPLDIASYQLKDIIENYSLHETPAKIALVSKIARELAGKSQKSIIWSTFVNNLEMLKKLLKDLNPGMIHGGIPFGDNHRTEFTRERVITEFKTNPKMMVLLANPAACAESISLHHVCHSAIYLDRSFNCAHYIQSMDRIHRLGLKPDDETNYYILIGKNTIDEVVNKRLILKMENMSHIMDGDFPREMPGYWDNNLGSEEEIDFNEIEKHLLELYKKNEN